jgi:DNA-binding response OmpR family regulator
MRDDRQHCLDAGANDYIAKPIEVDKLVSLCRVWMPR